MEDAASQAARGAALQDNGPWGPRTGMKVGHQAIRLPDDILWRRGSHSVGESNLQIVSLIPRNRTLRDIY